MNKSITFLVVFSIYSLCSADAKVGYHHPAYLYRGTGTANVSNGGYYAAPIPLYKLGTLPSPSKLVSPPPLQLTDASYQELIQTLTSKMRADFTTLGDKTWQHLSKMLCVSLKSAKDATRSAVSTLLWTIISIWFGVYWTLAKILAIFLWTFSIQSFCIILLCFITSLIFKAVKYCFESLPVYLFTYPAKLIWRAAFSKRNYKDEKAVEGFKGFVVPQKPPKSAVIELQHENGSHLGYANCIRLYSGENALVTAEHCLQGAYAASMKTGNRIPMSSFTPIYKSNPRDIAIMAGPPNWEGLLAVKGASFQTADKIGRGPASFFTLEKGEWMCNNAQIDGSHDKFVTVLCNTEAGCSGTGFWSSKTLLGVLKGYPLEEGCNYNVISVIPSIPGLTSPNYVFESTTIRGRVFSAEAIEEMEREAMEAVRKLLSFKSQTGKNWADYSDDEEYGDEKKAAEAPKKKAQAPKEETKEVPAEKTAQTNPQASLNGVAAPSAITTGTSATPSGATSAPPMDKMVEQIITAMVGRINLSEVERKIVERVSEKALKKPTQSKRGRRGGKNKPDNSSPISKPSTRGAPRKVQLPQASKDAVGPRVTTTPVPEVKPNGGANSAKFIPSWRIKQQASAGRKPEHKQNSKA
ncbi:ORF1 [Tobacco virus 2]|uniref:ORF1 n=1 Tax=Tobacco virus 2 TaxID=1972995 RepID=UPI0009C22498|nr:ORF1 [Tobacco virus 2]ARD08874.1 ORF1 [Tobacco virus 2]